LRCNGLLSIADQLKEISSEGCSTRPPGSLRSDVNSAPRVRQLCAKGRERHSTPRAGSVHRGETVQPCQ